MIGGVIEEVLADSVLVRITWAPPQGGRLRADKGINLPDSRLRIPALTTRDLEDLAFVSQNADVIEMSFVNSPEDGVALVSWTGR
jgi:pyruvate kinase